MRETSLPRGAAAAAGAVCGAGTAFVGFGLSCGVERALLWSADVPRAVSAALVPALLVGSWAVGRAAGARAGRAVRLAAGLLGVAGGVAWALLAGRTVTVPAACGLSFAMMAAAGAAAASAPPWPLSGGLCAGLVAALLGLAGVVPAWVVVLGGAVALCAGAVPALPAGGETSWPNSVAGVLVLLAVGLAWGLAARAYLPFAGSVGFVLADLGAAFAVGGMVGLALRGRGGGSGAVLGACACAVSALLSALSFAAYPDLVVGLSASLQTSPALLTPGRVFPAWLMAAGLGFVAFAVADRAWPSAIAGALGLAAAALAAGSYPAAPAAVLILSALAVATASVERRPGGRRVPVILTVGTLLACAAGAVALAAWDPHLGLVGVRMTLAAAAPETPLVPAEHTFDARGLRVRAEGAGAAALLANGRLVHLSSPGRADSAAFVLPTAVGLAWAPPGARVGVVGPATRETLAAARSLAGADRVTEVACGRVGACGVLVCGPGAVGVLWQPVSGAAAPLLQRWRRAVGPEGVVAVWLPAGRMEAAALDACLEDLSEVFVRLDVYVAGLDAIVLAHAGPAAGLDYGRLRGLFERPESARLLAEAGALGPNDLLLLHAATDRDLCTGGDAPRSAAARLVRSRPLGRDVRAPVRPGTATWLIQHRLAGTGDVLGPVRFASERARTVALAGFERAYADRARRQLAGLGGTGREAVASLRGFVNSGRARLDLLAAGYEEREARAGAALRALGCDSVALSLLEAAVRAGRDSFEVRSVLAGALESQGELAEALANYRRALEFRPESVRVMRRMAALLLAGNRPDAAARMLEDVVDRRPDSVADLLMLAELYAARLDRAPAAAALAERVLRLQPDNTNARFLLEATQGPTPVPAP